ncbi:MAG: dicarboxylate/amino acid:cation symporter [Bacteroidales bacterium]|jgi:proton glutamate symport protein|nr:dicarboxylate/amino acid:cation symporter [Bacteroidales bacterium]MDI9591930.1 dicarboxylate/amino acid:cation symporter [Bacteroidota bacterium]HOR76869.1 dicarboxylate/amino acid:cation symporter [Bacteroidales bacterium]HPL12255.1 dicarboxylate/amino acid:cation symporter [Bacteroidales bacterium]
MKKLELHWQILIALILAVLFGIYLKNYVGYIAWMGEVFLRALKMIIIPLIFSSIVSGITNIGSAESIGRLGLKTIIYYISTSIFAILTGLVLVNILKPGVGVDLNLSQTVDLDVNSDTLGQTLIKIIPDNIFLAMSSNGQMLSVIFFAMLFGFFITRIRSDYQGVLTGFFNGVVEVMMKLTMFIIKFTPFGIFGLVAEKVSQQTDLVALMQSMGLYMCVVLFGLIIHSAVTLPLLVKVLGRTSPLQHFNAMRTPLITAFSTSSSSATLPLTIYAVENNSGVSKRISSFVLPLGATINMDGTALYECVAAMFIAQAYGIELSVVSQIIVVITALLASIGAAGIPMAGLVMITIVLTAVGLPLEGVGLILAVDRILDMFRTTVNVWSDTCGAVIIAKTEKEKLKIDL